MTRDEYERARETLIKSGPKDSATLADRLQALDFEFFGQFGPPPTAEIICPIHNRRMTDHSTAKKRVHYYYCPVADCPETAKIPRNGQRIRRPYRRKEPAQ